LTLPSLRGEADARDAESDQGTSDATTPFADQSRRCVAKWLRSIFEYIELGKIGQTSDMIAQHADIERRLEGFPSQVLRRCTITHRLENPDFQARAGAASSGATFPMTAQYCFRSALGRQEKQPRR
jgi:hypothetical protein